MTPCVDYAQLFRLCLEISQDIQMAVACGDDDTEVKRRIKEQIDRKVGSLRQLITHEQEGTQ